MIIKIFFLIITLISCDFQDSINENNDIIVSPNPYESKLLRPRFNEIVSVKGRCDQNSLLNLPLKDALVICDCEGYEDILFSNESISNFYNCELLIETHDCFVKNVAANLKNRFKNSHKITSVMSIDDEKKAITYEFNELNGVNLTTKKMLLAEKRKAKMEWLFLQPFSIKKT